jgi:hypothetical protein
MTSVLLLVFVAAAVLGLVWAQRRRVPDGSSAGDASWYPAVWGGEGTPAGDGGSDGTADCGDSSADCGGDGGGD